MNMFMRFPGGKDKAITLSYDDGVYQDKRFMEIIDQHGLKCTFNINTGCFGEENASGKGRLSQSQVLELYGNSVHEVAVHARTHPFLESLPLPTAIDEVLSDRKKIENMFGKITRGMAYPFGTCSDQLIEGLKSIGIAYARTTVSTNDFRIPDNWLRLTATCHHNSPRLNELCDSFVAPPKYPKPKLFYMWGHTYEFDNNDNWNVIEDFAAKMGENGEYGDSIWYATNIEVYDYVESYRCLIFSIDGHTVYNPTAIALWFWCDGETYRVMPGETINF